MTDASSEELDVLKYVSTLHRGLMDERRRYETRFLFAVLALNLSVVAGLLRGDVRVALSDVWALRAALILVLAVMARLVASYLWYIHDANEKNKVIAQEAENLLLRKWSPTVDTIVGERMKNLKALAEAKRTKAVSRFSSLQTAWSWAHQVGAIVLITAVAIAFIATVHIEPPGSPGAPDKSTSSIKP